MNDIDLYSYFYNLVKQIPEGMITTYRELAIALGDEIAARSAGQMLAENPEPIVIPCHRVIRSDGTLGGFTHPEGIKKKIELLEKEGIKINNGRVENFENLLFKDFKTDFPLLRLKAEEAELKEKISFEDIDYEGIVSVDGSYDKRNIYLSFVTIDENLNVLDIKNYKDVVNFPYIPTYFSYREGNAILNHYSGKDLLILDGNGIMHPRGIGLATYVGIFKKIPTIGIAKSHLFGELDGEEIFYGKTQLGWYISKRYVSPGSNISIKKTYNIAKKLLKKGDPIKIAHIFSNKFRESEQQPQ